MSFALGSDARFVFGLLFFNNYGLLRGGSTDISDIAGGDVGSAP